MSQLVQTICDELRVSTRQLADGFGVENPSIVRLVKKYSDQFLKFGHIFERTGRHAITKFSPISNPTKAVGTKGQELVYFLNEEQATFAGTLTRNNEKTVQFKADLVAAFFEAKRQLDSLKHHQSTSEWITARQDGKVERRLETDAIKEFVEYAKANGSKNAQRYYGNLTRMQNAALFIIKGNFKNTRDAMSSRQLMTVAVSDGIVERAIREGLGKGLFYKDIFNLAKDRVYSFADLYGQSTIVDRALQGQSSLSLPEAVAA